MLVKLLVWNVIIRFVYNDYLVLGVFLGVINIVFGVGFRVGEVFVKYLDVFFVLFIGGIVTVKRIWEVCVLYCKKFLLEVWSLYIDLLESRYLFYF